MSSFSGLAWWLLVVAHLGQRIQFRPLLWVLYPLRSAAIRVFDGLGGV